ncbi:MAG: WbqC family protein [Deltaproteobacteria bacterium]|nr:WbqC family protein [Deltaproteobacteria bacterium]
MRLTCHPPVFLAWGGFFYKMLLADRIVLLDEIQFARGFTWINRNRLKCDRGELWLTVPVWKRGRGLQKISEVEICNERGWTQKHFQSITQNYKRSPYWEEHRDPLGSLFEKEWKRLIDFNLALLGYLKTALKIEKEFVLQSCLGVRGRGRDLIAQICREAKADIYLTPVCGKKYLDVDLLEKSGISVEAYKYVDPVYPQLWGDFLPRLSVLDLLLNCGGKSLDVLENANAQR